VASGERSNFHGSGETAAPSKIHLDHVTLTSSRLSCSSPAAMRILVAAQLAVAFIIVRSEGSSNQNGLY
jgi:hypothetical protein